MLNCQITFMHPVFSTSFSKFWSGKVSDKIDNSLFTIKVNVHSEVEILQKSFLVIIFWQAEPYIAGFDLMDGLLNCRLEGLKRFALPIQVTSWMTQGNYFLLAPYFQKLSVFTWSFRCLPIPKLFCFVFLIDPHVFSINTLCSSQSFYEVVNEL